MLFVLKLWPILQHLALISLISRMQIFFLSGLGADKTVFQFLNLGDHEKVFIDWIEPGKNESLRDYALRLKKNHIPDDGFIVGLSFGGMLATEIAKEYPLVKAIIISSSKTVYEVPPYYKTGKIMPLHHWVSDEVQRWFMMRMKWFFGLNTNESIKIYEDLIRNCNTDFNRWAVNAILNWDNTEVPENIIHIHGTHDKVLPYKYIQRADHIIPKGEHLMVMEQPDILSNLLKETINSNNFTRQVSSKPQQFANR